MVKSVAENYRAGGKSSLINSPTGSGKSVMGLMSAKEVADEIKRRTGRNVRVVWTALHEYLRDQVVAENVSLGIDLDHIVPYSVFGNFDRLSDFDGETVLVLDEAHHGSANTCMEMLRRLQPAFYIGLSATPMRGDKCDLPFQHVAKEASYDHLIENGWLAGFDHYTFNGSHTPMRVAEVYLSRDWGKSVIYFNSEEESQECHEELVRNGVKSSVVTAKSNKEEQIRAITNGELDVLINMKMLIEGFDLPSLQTVFVRDSNSPLCVTQMGGRVLRPAPVQKSVVHSSNSGFTFSSVATPSRKFCENEDGGWLELKTTYGFDEAQVDEFLRLKIDRMREQASKSSKRGIRAQAIDL